MAGFIVVIALIGLGGFLGSEFLPELDEGSIFLRGNFLRELPFKRMLNMRQRFVRLLLNILKSPL
jgi:Cu/Ag efflux pump CusA